MASMDGLVPITRAFLASYYDKYPFTPLSDDVSRLTSEIRSVANDLCKDFPPIEEEPKKKITKKKRGTKKKGWFSSMFQRLWTRKEKEIAIVTHSGFLFHALSFANCELRSMVIVDKSMLGSGPPTTNYPGKIPPDPNAPSDVVDEKN